MSRANLYFGDDETDSDTLDPDSDNLPFPKPLDRSKFLDSSFDPATFLESLTNRFQTLEDLQTELQDLVRSLNKELVDLVNDNYTDFLSLGDKLKGGEERIEEVRVGLLGFQRDVTGVRDLVERRSNQVRSLLEDKRALRKDIQTARTLLEVDERLEDLEGHLGILTSSKLFAQAETDEEEESIDGFRDWSDEWLAAPESEDLLSDEDEDDKTQSDIPRRLQRGIEQLQIIQLLCRKCGEQHPFILAQKDRLSQTRNVLRRDLEAAVRAQSDVGVKQRIIRMKSELDD